MLNHGKISILLVLFAFMYSCAGSPLPLEEGGSYLGDQSNFSFAVQQAAPGIDDFSGEVRHGNSSLMESSFVMFALLIVAAIVLAGLSKAKAKRHVS